MAVLVHRDKLSLAWLDCGDKFSLRSRSDLVQHLEQASRGNSRLASTWRQLILASTMRPAGMLTSLTWSARNALQSHSPTSPPSGFVYYHTSTHSSDNPYRQLLYNRCWQRHSRCKLQLSTQRERSRTMHLSSILTTLPLLYLSTHVVAHPTIEPLFWSEDLDEKVNQLRAHGVPEVNSSLSAFPFPAALFRPSPIHTPTFITHSI